MPVNPLPIIERITRYAVQEHPDRPWPTHVIPVVPVISRHTPLMAVVWHHSSDGTLDNQLDNAGGLEDVQFTITAVSQVRKNVARMADHIGRVIPYNSEQLSETAFDNSWIQVVTSGRIDVPASPLPELAEGELHLFTHFVGASQFDQLGVSLESCVRRRSFVWYDPSIDVWKGTVEFTASMTEESNA